MLWEKIGKGVDIKQDQGFQRNWNRIDRSNYCKDYGEWKRELGREKYLDEGRWGWDIKEQWARLRCGSIGREREKGFRDVRCRLKLQHIWICKRAREEISKDWIKEADKLELSREG